MDREMDEVLHELEVSDKDYLMEKYEINYYTLDDIRKSRTKTAEQLMKLYADNYGI